MNGDSFAKKFITSLVAALLINVFLLLLGNSGTISWFPPPVVFSLVGICLLLGLIFPFIWQYRQARNKIDSQKIYGVLHTAIRYCIAFNLASFGWKKLFGLQFVVPPVIAEKPMNQQSGEWLTWFYFGYSPAFALIVAFLQIIGSYFLLFRKTMLLAAIVLFAFMINLTLINICYHMNAGALTQSVLITIGLAYIILNDYRQLRDFFFNSITNIKSMTVSNGFAKNMFRLSAIVLSLLFTIYLKSLAK
ncbi:MAG: hypothetical protein QM726_16540 [Chitinophagaceae bacterium]